MRRLRSQSRRLACWLAFATSLLATTADVAHAERLFRSRAGGDAEARAVAPGIAHLRSLRLDKRALATLRAKTTVQLTDLPLGPDTIAAATLTQFSPFSGKARVEVVEADGVRQLALPDALYYHGRVDGDPHSIVVLVATPTEARGVVSTNGTTYRFGPDRTGTYRSWALRDVDPAAFPTPPPFCGDDAVALAQPVPGRPRLAAPSSIVPRSAYSPPLLVEVAVDTDQELLAKFQTTDGALAYLADLAANVSAIYDADAGVRVVFRYIRLWATTDPWTASKPGEMVFQTSAYWATNETGIPRDLVHFVSGKEIAGGAAFLDGLCNPGGYGASTVYGAFDVLDPSDTWDVVVVAHELGHNFGSVHTHCYDPPLDHCSGIESGCYSGTVELPPGGGTIMSYCHLFGGMSYINLTFGPTVGAVLRNGAENGMCIGPPCGDGQLDPGEECDDGNVTDGDCCSPACTALPDGGPCDDGNTCTTAGTCAAGTCVGGPVADGTPCDDGKVCNNDACLAGTCVGVAGPATICKQPTLPQTSKLLLKVDRTTEARDKVTWTWRKGAATTLEEFGDPVQTNGYELCIYDAGSNLVFSGRIPAGRTCGGVPCWTAKTRGRGFAYKDGAWLPDGMHKLTLKPGDAGRADISASGKHLWLEMPALAGLTFPLEVQLHGAGGCWGATFSAPYLVKTDQVKAKSD